MTIYEMNKITQYLRITARPDGNYELHRPNVAHCTSVNFARMSQKCSKVLGKNYLVKLLFFSPHSNCVIKCMVQPAFSDEFSRVSLIGI